MSNATRVASSKAKVTAPLAPPAISNPGEEGAKAISEQIQTALSHRKIHHYTRFDALSVHFDGDGSGADQDAKTFANFISTFGDGFPNETKIRLQKKAGPADFLVKRAIIDLATKMTEFQTSHPGERSLCVVHYAGQATALGPLLNDRLVLCRDLESPPGEDLSFGAFRQLLKPTHSYAQAFEFMDVLIILDCCHPGPSIVQGSKFAGRVVEVVSAASFYEEARVQQADPNPLTHCSFTKKLFDSLQIQPSPLVNVEQAIQDIRRECEWGGIERMPVYERLSGDIALRLPRNDAAVAHAPIAWSTSTSQSPAVPKQYITYEVNFTNGPNDAATKQLIKEISQLDQKDRINILSIQDSDTSTVTLLMEVPLPLALEVYGRSGFRMVSDMSILASIPPVRDTKYGMVRGPVKDSRRRRRLANGLSKLPQLDEEEEEEYVLV